MAEDTRQMKEWKGTFGKEYTDRNTLTFEEMESLYRKNYGFSRRELNDIFLAGIDKSIRILEVGSNVGNQLICLQKTVEYPISCPFSGFSIG